MWINKFVSISEYKKLGLESDWNDFNPSDPGITIADQLSYALSDLEYRSSFEIVDLFSQSDTNNFYSPRIILTNAPLTQLDYRKLLLDLPGIRNAVINAAEQRFYYNTISQEISLQVDQPLLEDESIGVYFQANPLKGLYRIAFYGASTLRASVNDLLASRRNLCTDFAHIDPIRPQFVSIQLNLELLPGQNTDQVFQQVDGVLQQYIDPTIPRYDILNGQPLEEVFEGPELYNGWIKNADLIQFQPRREIRRSDIINELMDISGVAAVRQLWIAHSDEENEVPDFDQQIRWLIPLDSTKGPVFHRTHSTLTLQQSGLVVMDAQSFAETDDVDEGTTMLTPRFPLPQGRNRDVGRYTSIRHHFPAIYGITPQGLPENAGIVRRAQAKQFSAYLLFFEQILAHYFTQLEGAARLLSLEALDTSYFDRMVADLVATSGLFFDTAAERQQFLQSQLSFYRQQQQDIRLNRFLDHLLARVAEPFPDGVIRAGASSSVYPTVLEAKRAFLKNYPTVSANRGLGFNYRAEAGAATIGGFEQRLYHLLGITIPADGDYNLAAGLEGFYAIEHILLRPDASLDQNHQGPMVGCVENGDPYSLQMTFLFHRIGRFVEAQFRDFTEGLLRQEVPAHIRYEVLWLDTDLIQQWEPLWGNFKQALSLKAGDPFAFRLARDRVLDFLFLVKPTQALIGLTYPISDLPLSQGIVERVELQSTNEEEDFWRATLCIPYAQQGIKIRASEIVVEYELLTVDLVRIPSIDDSPAENSITWELGDYIQEESKPPCQTMTIYNINEDTTFRLRAVKRWIQNGEEKTFRVYLNEPLTVRVGVETDIGVAFLELGPNQAEAAAQIIEEPEIDYGNRFGLELSDIQPEVYYQIFDVNNNALSAIQSGAVVGNADTIRLLLDDPLLDNQNIVLRGSRDPILNPGVNDRLIREIEVRVRANHRLLIQLDEIVLPFGGQPTVRLVGENEPDRVEANVRYALYVREVSDPEFVHQLVDFSEPTVEISTVQSNQTIQVVQPRRPIPAVNPPAPFTPRNFAPIVYQLVDERQVDAPAEELTFDTSGLSLKEDSLFIVLAEKLPKPDQLANFTHPAILHRGNRTTIGVALIEPQPLVEASALPADAELPAYQVDPAIVPAGNTGQVRLSNVQAGVKYYLQFANGQKQSFRFLHDQVSDSPRQDGVGRSKVEVDLIPGPVAYDPESEAPKVIVVETRNPLNGDRTLKLRAEKIQTGITIDIAEIEFRVE